MFRAAVKFWFVAAALAQGTGAIQGVVTGPAGDGIADAAVVLSRSLPPGSDRPSEGTPFRVAQTGRNGAFRIEGIPPGQYDIEIGSPGFTSFVQHQTEIQAGQRVNLGSLQLGLGYPPCLTSVPYQPPFIELRALPSGETRLSGTAYDPEVREYAGQAEFSKTDWRRVSIVLENRQEKLKGMQTTINSNGEFAFESVPPGTYEVRASLSGHATFVIDQVPVKAGRQTVISAFPLEKCPLIGLCRARRRFREIRICE